MIPLLNSSMVSSVKKGLEVGLTKIRGFYQAFQNFQSHYFQGPKMLYYFLMSAIVDIFTAKFKLNTYLVGILYGGPN